MWLRKASEIIGAVSGLVLCFIFFYTPSKAQKTVITPAVAAGFRTAQRCYPSTLKLRQFKLNVVPGDNFQVGRQHLLGLGLFRRIFVADAVRNDSLIWAHEFIHGFGVIGHPRTIFDKCDL